MRTIETKVIITSQGILTGQVPPDIPPGEHRAVIVLEEPPTGKPARQPLRFSAYQVGLVSDQMTFRREELYDDTDR